jgi:protein-S-isoprenylcysteine O-methyltransferase Ste14
MVKDILIEIFFVLVFVILGSTVLATSMFWCPWPWIMVYVAITLVGTVFLICQVEYIMQRLGYRFLEDRN